jgi:hypothetical protein
MKRKLSLVAAALALMAPIAATQAEEIGYTYVDLGYVTTDIDGIRKDVDGFVLRGSLEVADNWFVYGRYSDQGADFSGHDVDVERYSVGGGYAWTFAENMDLFGKLGYTEVDASGEHHGDDDGYELGVGIRARPLTALELEGSINYVDLSDRGDDTSFGVAGLWYIAEHLALAVEGEFADEEKTYGVGFRWEFGG